jgi:predicted secreted hydrolase
MGINLGGFKDSDDTLHPYSNEEYYEWWYFDARMDNGYSCVATFHWLNAFIKPHVPTVQLFIYTPEGKKYIGMAAVKQEDCHSSAERCDVKMGENYAIQQGDTYKIHMRARNLGVDLTYHRRIPGWKQNGTGYLYDIDGKKQGWIISAPRSDVEGSLYIKDEAIPVTGRGYHDKNWGNSNIYDCFSGWYWGRLYDPEFTLIYYWLFPADHPDRVISRLLLARQNEPILVTNDYNLTVEKSESCTAFGQQLPQQIILGSKPDAAVQFRCELTTTSVVERDLLPKISQWEQYHWRFLGEHRITLNENGKSIGASGKALHEHLIFR